MESFRKLLIGSKKDMPTEGQKTTKVVGRSPHKQLPLPSEGPIVIDDKEPDTTINAFRNKRTPEKVRTDRVEDPIEDFDDEPKRINKPAKTYQRSPLKSILAKKPLPNFSNQTTNTNATTPNQTQNPDKSKLHLNAKSGPASSVPSISSSAPGKVPLSLRRKGKAGLRASSDSIEEDVPSATFFPHSPRPRPLSPPSHSTTPHTPHDVIDITDSDSAKTTSPATITPISSTKTTPSTPPSSKTTPANLKTPTSTATPTHPKTPTPTPTATHPKTPDSTTATSKTPPPIPSNAFYSSARETRSRTRRAIFELDPPPISSPDYIPLDTSKEPQNNVVEVEEEEGKEMEKITKETKKTKGNGKEQKETKDTEGQEAATEGNKATTGDKAEDKENETEKEKEKVINLDETKEADIDLELDEDDLYKHDYKLNESYKNKELSDSQNNNYYTSFDGNDEKQRKTEAITKEEEDTPPTRTSQSEETTNNNKKINSQYLQSKKAQQNNKRKIQEITQGGDNNQPTKTTRATKTNKSKNSEKSEKSKNSDETPILVFSPFFIKKGNDFGDAMDVAVVLEPIGPTGKPHKPPSPPSPVISPNPSPRSPLLTASSFDEMPPSNLSPTLPSSPALDTPSPSKSKSKTPKLQGSPIGTRSSRRNRPDDGDSDFEPQEKAPKKERIEKGKEEPTKLKTYTKPRRGRPPKEYP